VDGFASLAMTKALAGNLGMTSARLEAEGVSRLIWLRRCRAGCGQAEGDSVRSRRRFLALFVGCVGPLVALRRYVRWRGLGGDRLPVFLDIVACFIAIAFAMIVTQQAAGARFPI
jgi:hypothetical protein